MENKKYKLLSKNFNHNKNKSFNNLLGFTPIYTQTQNKNNLPHFITPHYMAPLKTKLKLKKSPFKKIYTLNNKFNNNNSNFGTNNNTFTNYNLNNRSVTPPLIYKRERLLENKNIFNNNNNKKSLIGSKLMFENKLVFE